MIKIIKDKDIFKKVKFEKPEKYQKRITVKGIIKNPKNNKFAFVTNEVHNFILLAGGGAESDNLEEEINRECQEEIFYSIKNIKKNTEVLEFRNRNAKEYQTVCFYGEIDKKIEEDRRTTDEKNNGLKLVWLDLGEALDIMKKQVEKVKRGEVGFYNIAFNIIRDFYFLKEYEK